MTSTIASVPPAPRMAIGDYETPLAVDHAKLPPLPRQKLKIDESKAANPIWGDVIPHPNYLRFRPTANNGLGWSPPPPDIKISPLPDEIKPLEGFAENDLTSGFLIGGRDFSVSAQGVVAIVNPTQRAQRMILDAMRARGITTIYGLFKISDFRLTQLSKMLSKGIFPRTGMGTPASHDPRYKRLAQALGLNVNEFCTVIEQAQIQDSRSATQSLLNMKDADLSPRQRVQKMILEAMQAKGIKKQRDLVNNSQFHETQISKMIKDGYFPSTRDLKPAAEDPRYQKMARFLGLDEEKFYAAIEKTRRPKHEIIETRKKTYFVRKK